MNGFKYETLEELVNDCRRLGVDIFKSPQVEVRLTAAPRTSPEAAPPATGAPVAPQPKRCPCGCQPWQCSGVAPCRKGCQYAQCHPERAPTIEATKAVKRRVT